MNESGPELQVLVSKPLPRDVLTEIIERFVSDRVTFGLMYVRDALPGVGYTCPGQKPDGSSYMTTQDVKSVTPLYQIWRQKLDGETLRFASGGRELCGAIVSKNAPNLSDFAEIWIEGRRIK